MKKVYDIFVADSVELTVRRSAADQLATILAGLYSTASKLDFASTTFLQLMVWRQCR